MQDTTRRDALVSAAGAGFAAPADANEAPSAEGATTQAVASSALESTEGGTTFENYVAVPQGLQGRAPTVLLCHEWSGLNPSMKAAADRIAELGYACVALDVYGKGVRGDEAGDNTHLVGPLMADRALLRRRLLAGVRASFAHPSVDPSRAAVMGYCFGGLCALDLVRTGAADLKGAISLHGVFAPPNLGPQPPIRAKVLILHGWEDPMAPPTDLLALAKELTDAQADWQLHAYGRAMHAFTAVGLDAPERGLRYDADADRRSWAATRAFLEEVIGPPHGAALR